MRPFLLAYEFITRALKHRVMLFPKKEDTMRKLLTVTLAVFALILVTGASLSLAQGRMGPPGWQNGQETNYPGFWRFHRSFMGAQLTEEQQEALRTLRSKYEQPMYQVMSELMAKQAELTAELSTVSPDKGKAQKIAETIGDIYERMVKLRIEYSMDAQKRDVPCRWGQNGYGMGGGMMGSGYGMGRHMMGGHMMGGQW